MASIRSVRRVKAVKIASSLTDYSSAPTVTDEVRGRKQTRGNGVVNHNEINDILSYASSFTTPTCARAGSHPPRTLTNAAIRRRSSVAQPDPGRMIRFSTTSPEFPIGFAALLNQARETTETVDRAVSAIIADVRARGDTALIDYTARFDRVTLAADRLRIGATEIDDAIASVPEAQRAALDIAAARIEAFHRAQLPADLKHTDSVGMTLGMRWLPLDSVGLYVCPAARPLLSILRVDERDPRARRARRPCDRDVRAVRRGRHFKSVGACTRRGAQPASRRSIASAALRRWRRLRSAPKRSSRWIALSAQGTPMSRRPSVRCSAASVSTISPARPRSW